MENATKPPAPEKAGGPGNSKEGSATPAQALGDKPKGRKRPSGAQRRKEKKAKAAVANPGGSKPPGTPVPQPKPLPSALKGETGRIGTPKRNRSEGSTPQEAKRAPKRLKGTTSGSKSFKEALTEFKVAIVHEELDSEVSEEEADRIKIWILRHIDELRQKGAAVHPQFSECRLREGALRVSCADQSTKDWLGGLLQHEQPLAGTRLRLVEAKDLPKPVRTIAWVPGPAEEPAKVIDRLGQQNPTVTTDRWKVVNAKVDPKGQQLTVLMDQKSWEELAKCDHRPYVNFTRVTFKALAGSAKAEKEKGEEKMETEEGPEAEPKPSTSSAGGGKLASEDP